MKRLIGSAIAIGMICFGIVWTGCQKSVEKTGGSTKKKKQSESELAYVTLSKKAHKSLNIKTAPVRTELVQEEMQWTGWVMPVQGSEVTLTAPVSGFVRLAPKATHAPFDGDMVSKNQPLYVIEPVLSAVEQVQMSTLKRAVDGEIIKAIKSKTVAKKAFDRISDLHKKGLRSKQEFEKAEEQLLHATEDLKSAQDKLKLLALQTVTVKAPQSATVLTVSVSPGQFVTSSAPLMTIADMSRLWMRVPVPDHDAPAVNRKQPVRFRFKGKTAFTMIKAQTKRDDSVAKPVVMVPKVDLVRRTIDLIYELPQKDVARGSFVKDQMLTVYVPFGGKSKQSVVPYSSVVYDGQGGSWIYLDRTKSDSSQFLYERKRVELGPLIGDDVVIQPAADSKDRVVTEGAGVIISREFHSGPVDE